MDVVLLIYEITWNVFCSGYAMRDNAEQNNCRRLRSLDMYQEPLKKSLPVVPSTCLSPSKPRRGRSCRGVRGKFLKSKGKYKEGFDPRQFPALRTSSVPHILTRLAALRGQELHPPLFHPIQTG